MTARPTTYRRPISIDGDIVWLPASLLADVYSRDVRTIHRWCVEGYFITLGYRLRREPRGQWRVGVPSSEFRTFKTLQLAIADQP
jgi:hypothetical protein